MPGLPCAPLPAPGPAALVRDAGGLAVPGGRLRTEVLFRFSGSLLEPPDFDALTRQGVRLVVDLRGDKEDRSPLQRWASRSGVGYHHEPIEVARPDLLAAWGSGLDAEEAEAWLRDIYRHLVDDHSARLTAAISAMSRCLPAAFGCAAGKDRTGLVAALIQTLLGADRHDVARHYAAMPPAPERLAPIARRWRDLTGPLSPGTRTMLAAPAEVMLATLDHITDRYGGVEPYLLGAGLDPGAVDLLRRALVRG